MTITSKVSGHLLKYQTIIKGKENENCFGTDEDGTEYGDQFSKVRETDMRGCGKEEGKNHIRL